jgi:hypothetical protein
VWTTCSWTHDQQPDDSLTSASSREQRTLEEI